VSRILASYATVVPRVRVRSIPRRAFDAELLARLHALATSLLVEDAEHFRVHAESNELVHLFEQGDDLVGFQFWRTAPLDLPRSRVILGGKLRVLPAFRGRALHLRSGLRFYLENQLRHPLTRFYRLSFASLFGFVSITSALAEYQMFDPRAGGPEGRALRGAFERFAAENDFRIDEKTGLVFVDIRMSEATLAAYPAADYDRAEARRYAELNPGFRDNRSNVAFWFRFTPRNLRALVHKIRAKSGS
jgi:hypothetical protein